MVGAPLRTRRATTTVGRVAEHETSWTMIDAARDGDAAARERFVGAYASVVRSYLVARWSRSRLAHEIDDAVQDVFVDCLRERGALLRSDPARPFRPFLYGVTRTVALRYEQRAGRADGVEPAGEEHEARETRLSVAFDREFAVQIMREATQLQRERAREAGALRQRRVELLDLRFQRGLSIADIAALWNEDAARVHHVYADAREDFRDALREVVKQRSGAQSADLERECAWMLEVLNRTKG